MTLIIPHDQLILMFLGVFEGWGQGCTGWKLFLWTLLHFVLWLIFGTGWLWDSHHMQVSFCCPQGWTGAKILPCSSSFGKANCWCQRIAASLLPAQQCSQLFLFYLKCKGGTTLLPPSSLFCLQAAFPSPVKPQDIHSLLSGWTNQSKPLTGLSDIHLLPEMCAPFISSPPSPLRAIWWCVYLFFRFSGWAPSLDNVMGWRNLSESAGIEEAKNLQEIQCMLAGPQVHVQVFLPRKISYWDTKVAERQTTLSLPPCPVSVPVQTHYPIFVYHSFDECSGNSQLFTEMSALVI